MSRYVVLNLDHAVAASLRRFGRAVFVHEVVEQRVGSMPKPELVKMLAGHVAS